MLHVCFGISLSLQLICTEAPSPGTAEDSGCFCAQFGRSAGILIRVGSLERNLAAQMRYYLTTVSSVLPGKKNAGPSHPHITMSSRSSLGGIFGRLYTTGIILTIPVGHYYLTL